MCVMCVCDVCVCVCVCVSMCTAHGTLAYSTGTPASVRAQSHDMLRIWQHINISTRIPPLMLQHALGILSRVIRVQRAKWLHSWPSPQARFAARSQASSCIVRGAPAPTANLLQQHAHSWRSRYHHLLMSHILSVVVCVRVHVEWDSGEWEGKALTPMSADPCREARSEAAPSN